MPSLLGTTLPTPVKRCLGGRYNKSPWSVPSYFWISISTVKVVTLNDLLLQYLRDHDFSKYNPTTSNLLFKFTVNPHPNHWLIRQPGPERTRHTTCRGGKVRLDLLTSGWVVWSEPLNIPKKVWDFREIRLRTYIFRSQRKYLRYYLLLLPQ